MGFFIFMKSKSQQILSKVSDVINNKPTTKTFDVQPKNFIEKVLMYLKLKQRSVTFTITPIKLRNVYRIASKAVLIPDDFLDRPIVDIVANYFEHVVYIVAVGLQNDSEEPSKRLIELIKDNFSNEEVAEVLLTIFNSLNIKDFLTSIVLIKGMNILQNQTSLKTQEEIIASALGDQ